MTMKETALKFRGKQSDAPELGIAEWLEWGRPYLPETRDQLLEIPGRDGAYDFGRELQPLRIPCRFLVIAPSFQGMREKARAVAVWLAAAVPAELIFGDEQDKFYRARPTGPVSQKQIFTTGEGSVTFLVPSGCAEAVTPKQASSFPATNAGTVECHSTITVTMGQVSDDLRITLVGTGEYVQLAKHATRWNHSLAINDVVVIDTGKQKATVNGLDARAGVVFASDYFKLPPGDFTVQIDKTGTVQVEYRELFRG